MEGRNLPAVAPERLPNVYSGQILGVVVNQSRSGEASGYEDAINLGEHSWLVRYQVFRFMAVIGAGQPNFPFATVLHRAGH